jgi:predicted transcriptional regulator
MVRKQYLNPSKHPASTGQVTGQVAPWISKVLSACVEPRSSAEIQMLTGMKHRETFQRNYLDMLLKDGLIERTIPDKPRSRHQRYRTTAKGKKILESRIRTSASLSRLKKTARSAGIRR